MLRAYVFGTPGRWLKMLVVGQSSKRGIVGRNGQSSVDQPVFQQHDILAEIGGFRNQPAFRSPASTPDQLALIPRFL